MNNRVYITSIVILTVVVLLAVFWFQGKPMVSGDFLRPTSLVSTIVGATALVLHKWAWSWWIFRGWYIKRPDLRGTWRVRMKSDWKDENGIQVPEIDAYVVVRQTLFMLSMRLVTSESKSRLVAHSIECEPDGLYTVAAVYRNEPAIELQGTRSRMHHGSFFLEVQGATPTVLDGHYWTDRGTRGSMRMYDRRSFTADSYQDAEDRFAEAFP
jgi:hypothetical protein